MDEKVAKWLFIGILCLLTGVRFYYKIRYYRLVTVKAFAYESKWLVVFRYVLGIGLLVITGAIVVSTNPIGIGRVTLPGTLRFAGSVLALLSVLLLVAAHHALGPSFSTTIETGQVGSVVRSGPYRYIRHPIYVAYVSLFLGLFLLIANWLFGFLGTAIILSLMLVRLRYEEEALMAKFPKEYLHYKLNTGAFIPRFSRVEKVMSDG
jgi:protein-S-isoprenylcysteine O-methyltransferase Ste14